MFEPELSNPNAREKVADKGMRNYWINNNLKSIDGLPGVEIAPYAKPTPRSGWSAEHGKRKAPVEKGVVSKKGAKADFDAKLVAAFSLGVLVTALFMRLSGLMVV